jgi:hypothetical protein
MKVIYIFLEKINVIFLLSLLFPIYIGDIFRKKIGNNNTSRNIKFYNFS